MSGRPHIKITESGENWRQILKQQKKILAYNKVQMLYLFQSKKVETVREVSAVLGKSEATTHRWGEHLNYAMSINTCNSPMQELCKM